MTVTSTAHSWNVSEENAVGLNPDRAPRLRRYPPPYRAALAISNDTDGMGIETFAALHDFVNGAGPTPLGDGLELEMSDSFWIWSAGGQLSLSHQMPFEKPLRLSREAAYLQELARIGLLDTLHGFGAWEREWKIDREAALRGVELLAERGIRPTVYVNHGGRNPVDGGGGLHMTHNIGGPWGYYQGGDVPGHRSYCLDLLLEAGTRYFWTDICFELTKFGEHLTFNRQRDLDRAVSAYNFRRLLVRRSTDETGEVEPAFPGSSEAQLHALKQRFFNRVLVPTTARDGTQITVFKRYRGELAPNAATFALQVASHRLDELEKREGAVVIYQHFGIWRALGAGKGHASHRRNVPPALDEHAVWAFRELAERQRAGRLFFTTTGRLLDYLHVRDRLDYEVCEAEGRRAICVHGVVEENGTTSHADVSRLQGITFVVPRTWETPLLKIGDRLHDTIFERQPGDGDNDTLTVPWQRLEYVSSREF